MFEVLCRHCYFLKGHRSQIVRAGYELLVPFSLALEDPVRSMQLFAYVITCVYIVRSILQEQASYEIYRTGTCTCGLLGAEIIGTHGQPM